MGPAGKEQGQGKQGPQTIGPVHGAPLLWIRAPKGSNNLLPFQLQDEHRKLAAAKLARHSHRPFADQWDFVDYVHQHKLGLELITPARSRMRSSCPDHVSPSGY
jgi:hypothetical protein